MQTESDDKTPRGFAEAPAACVIPLMITASACVVLFFYARPIIAFIDTAFGSGS